MTTIASRDLRNHTGDVLRSVAEGKTLTITVHGEPVAEIRPVERRRTFLRRTELATLLAHQADPGLTATLDALAGDTTDDLDPL